MAREDNAVTRTMTERLSPEQRKIRDIMEKVEAFYLTTHNDPEVKREIDVVVRGASRAAKDGHILLITAESQSGKTTMVNHYLDEHPSLVPFPIENDNTAYPLFKVTAPPDSTMAGLGREMAMRLGYQLHRRVTEPSIFEKVRAQLQVQGTRLVVVNEIQHVLDAPSIKGLRHFSDAFKNLLQEEDWPIHIIFVGLPEAKDMIKRDKKEQLEARVMHLALEPLSLNEHGEAIADMIDEVLAIAGLGSGTPLTNEFLARLFHGARDRLGLIFKMLHFAIEDALDSGDTEVVIEHWEDAYMRLAKGGRNVFVEPEWWTIVRGVRSDGFLTTEKEEADLAASKSGAGGSQKSGQR
ncbi:ATP-binding protein [Rhizobium sp. 16-449-1b]|uniref:TniB family NTP-binding protein n=1 Tax=Rhizobium sp. 16-449-1b TaxID=2819989 RepID=UPI001ADB4520|nr:ATP-binding protein [Rhizobium sp. 16-449-1b]MBO9197534.1 ATP-binding protein [Rhizobium sp. 16-449-1b]